MRAVVVEAVISGALALPTRLTYLDRAEICAGKGVGREEARRANDGVRAPAGVRFARFVDDQP